MCLSSVCVGWDWVRLKASARSQELLIRRSSTCVAGAQGLGPCSRAFPRALVRSWVESGAVGARRGSLAAQVLTLQAPG